MILKLLVQFHKDLIIEIWKNDNPIDKKVNLKDEIEYINNYIELQKLRITSNNKVVFNVEGKIRNEKIYPLLFISLLENAFKNGVYNKNKIKIKINRSNIKRKQWKSPKGAQYPE